MARIAQIAPLGLPCPPQGYGGIERVVASLADGLADAGHEVTLFAAEGSRSRARVAAQCLPLRERGGDIGALSQVEEAAMLDRLKRVADRFDVLHFHTEFFHYALFGDDPRVVTTLHWRVDERDRRTLFAHFRDARVVCVSDAQRRMLPEGMGRAHVIHHGIEPGRYPPGGGEGGYLAFLGRLSDQKRPEWAIAVARALGMPLKLAGYVDHGNDGYFAREVAPRLGDGVEFVGLVGEADKADFLGRAAALVFPLDWPEPFGMAMIEAMACATPVVAWRRGSVAEVVDDGVTGVVVDDVEGAVAGGRRALALDRAGVRAGFERRFRARRMVGDHLALYRAMGVRDAGEGATRREAPA
ncbi:MAG: glycosyltransferase [Paracoccaceae bacterium]